MLLHVTYIEDSTEARQRPSLVFWAVDQNIALRSNIDIHLKPLEKTLNELPPPVNVYSSDKVVCAFIAGQWRRAKILEDATKEHGKVKTFLMDTGEICQTPLSYLRYLPEAMQALPSISLPGLAVEHILADVAPPRSPGPIWSELAMRFLKTEVEGKLWYADRDSSNYTRLYSIDTNQPLANIMVERYLALPSQTYHLLARGLSPAPSNTSHQMPGHHFLPSTSTLPAVFRSPSLPFTSPEQLIEASFASAVRRYNRNEFPSVGRYPVELISSPQGPYEFIVRLSHDEYLLTSLQSRLQAFPLRTFSCIPTIGAPCILRSFDGIFYRGSVVSYTDANQYIVELVDHGRSELCDTMRLRDIPDEFLRVPIFTYRLSLEDAEKIMHIKGVNDVFHGITAHTKMLVAEAVRGVPNRVVLFNHEGRNLRDILADIFGLTGLNAAISTTPLPRLLPTLLDIPDDVLEVERVLVTRAKEPGRFFGKLKKCSPREMDRLNMEMFVLYEKELSPPLLYADAKSHVGQCGVIKLLKEDKYFRVRILKEMVNEVQVLLVDDGREMPVARCDIFVPLSSLSLFALPSFGIMCKTEIADMSEMEWETLFLNIEVEIQIHGKESGVYTVSLTENHCNLALRSLLTQRQRSYSSPDESLPPSPPCSDEGTPSPSHSSPPKPPSHQERVPSPSRDSISPMTPSNEESAPSGQARPSSRGENRRIREGFTSYQHPNAASRNGGSKADKDTNWRSGNGQTQEVIRNPRGPPPMDLNARGPVGFLNNNKNNLNSAPQQPSDSPTLKEPSTPTAAPAESQKPSPQDAYPAQVAPQGMKSVQMVYVEAVDKFYVQLSESFVYLADELQVFYSDSSKPCIRNPQIGLPCVAKYSDDGFWYRGQITATNGEEAEVFFVDYGNSQKTPLGAIKAIDPNFQKVQAQAYLCRMAGVCTQPKYTEKDLTKLTSYVNQELEAKFVSMDSNGKFLVRLFSHENGTRHVINSHFGAPSVENVKAVNITYHSNVSPAVNDFTVGAFHSVDHFFLRASDVERFKDEEASFEEFYASLVDDELIESRPVVGMPVAARCEKDNRYYRSRVTAVNDNFADVVFVDYGVEQTIARSSIKHMLASFVIWPVLAWECHLKGVKAVPLFGADREQRVAECFVEGQTVKARLRHTVTDETYEAEVTHPKYGDLSKYLLEKNLVELPAVPIKFASSLAPQDLDALVAKGHFEGVVVYCAPSPSEFWAQLAPPAIDELMKEIKNLSKKLEFQNESTFQPEVGKACLARYEDNTWYRAVITEINAEQVVVQYVDYGNTETISVAELRGLPQELAREPYLAVRCCLQGAQELPTAAGTLFSALFEKAAKLEVVGRDGNVLNVKLENIAVGNFYEHLVAHFKQTPDETTTQTEAFQESLSEHHVSREISHEAVSQETLQREPLLQMSAATPETSVQEDVSEGAHQSEAAYLSTSNEKSLQEVSEEETPITETALENSQIDIKQEPFDHADLISSSSIEEAIEILEETPTCQRYVDVLTPVTERTELESQSQATIDENLSDQVAVADETAFVVETPEVQCVDELPAFFANLLPGQKMSTQAVVWDIGSAENIFLDMNGRAISKLIAGMRDIEGLPLLVPQVGRACLSLFPEDGKWYRAEVKSVNGEEAKVFYVDYGNFTVVQTKNLRRLPHCLAQLPPGLACALDGVNRKPAAIPSQEDLAFLYNEETLTVIFVSRTADLTFVRLIDKHGIDLNSKVGLPEMTTSGPLLNQSVVKAAFGDVTMLSVGNDDTCLEVDKTVTDVNLEDQDKEPPILPAQFETLKTEPIDSSAILPPDTETATAIENSSSMPQQPINCELNQETELVVTAQLEDLSANPMVVLHTENATGLPEAADADNNDDVDIDPDQTLVVEDTAACFVPDFAASLAHPTSSEENNVEIETELVEEANRETITCQRTQDPTVDIGPSEKIYVSFALSAAHFWIQYYQDMRSFNVDKQLEELNSEERGELFENPVVGGMYAAYSTIYGGWFRGRIVNQNKKDASVLFVDYGDTETVLHENIRELPDTLRELAPYAHECKWLAAVEDPEMRTKGATDTFSEICTPATVVKAVFNTKKTNGLSEIQALYANGKNVADLIKAKLAV